MFVHSSITVSIRGMAVSFRLGGRGISGLGRCIVGLVARGLRCGGFRTLGGVAFSIGGNRRLTVLNFGNTNGDALLGTVMNICGPAAKGVRGYNIVTPLLRLNTNFSPGCSNGRGVFLCNTVLNCSERCVRSGCSRVIRFSRLNGFVGIPLGGCSSNVGTELNFSVTATIRPSILVLSRILSMNSTGFHAGDLGGIRSVFRGNMAILFISRDVSRIGTVYSATVLLSRNGVVTRNSISAISGVCSRVAHSIESDGTGTVGRRGRVLGGIITTGPGARGARTRGPTRTPSTRWCYLRQL